jgi:hypothetical protein
VAAASVEPTVAVGFTVVPDSAEAVFMADLEAADSGAASAASGLAAPVSAVVGSVELDWVAVVFAVDLAEADSAAAFKEASAATRTVVAKVSAPAAQADSAKD